jgi:hypothetical protein
MTSRMVETIRIDMDELQDFLRHYFEENDEWRDYSPNSIAAWVAKAVTIGYPRKRKTMSSFNVSEVPGRRRAR